TSIQQGQRSLRKAGAADITVLTFARSLSEPI
ncbi:ComF family protein, partial [Rhizobium johnstonii]